LADAIFVANSNKRMIIAKVFLNISTTIQNCKINLQY
jgi:hypothetical protein